MTLLLRALVLGFGVATSAAVWLSASGMALWTAVLVAWIGGNALGFGFAAVGASLWPTAPARRSSFVVTAAEFRVWDEDLARELIDADLRRDAAEPAGQESAGQESGGQGARRRAAG